LKSKRVGVVRNPARLVAIEQLMSVAPHAFVAGQLGETLLALRACFDVACGGAELGATLVIRQEDP
jgi:hypothetical protein